MWIRQRAEPLIGYEEAHGDTTDLTSRLGYVGAGVHRAEDPPRRLMLAVSEVCAVETNPLDTILKLAHEPLCLEGLCPFSVLP